MSQTTTATEPQRHRAAIRLPLRPVPVTMMSIDRSLRRSRAAARALLGIVAGAFVAVGCNDERVGVSPPRPLPPPISSNAWLLVSDTLAHAGTEVTIAAFARSDTGASVGSFSARFLYDTLQLQVVGPDSTGDAVLRAVNPVLGEYRVAGASATGIPGGLLFRVRARVIDPRGLRRLGLLVDELHNTSLADLTAKLEVQDTRGALFSGMPNVRVSPDRSRVP